MNDHVLAPRADVFVFLPVGASPILLILCGTITPEAVALIERFVEDNLKGRAGLHRMLVLPDEVRLEIVDDTTLDELLAKRETAAQFLADLDRRIEAKRGHGNVVDERLRNAIWKAVADAGLEASVAGDEDGGVSITGDPDSADDTLTVQRWVAPAGPEAVSRLRRAVAVRLQHLDYTKGAPVVTAVLTLTRVHHEVWEAPRRVIGTFDEVAADVVGAILTDDVPAERDATSQLPS